MGIDVHTLYFLKYAAKEKAFADTITIGRQSMAVIEPTLRRIVSAGNEQLASGYCERLLIDCFGATRVDSIDNSTYENATYVHDMNLPVPSGLEQRYDTVIDGGCLEHIFNIPQALKNCSRMCKPGGQILHILPANNFCGHGFWQFSPELFFSLYSPGNGYESTEVFLANLSDSARWYKVRQPKEGNRVNIYSSTAIYVLVRTVLRGDGFSHESVQQSDYVFTWKEKHSDAQRSEIPIGHPVLRIIKQALKRVPLVYEKLSNGLQLFGMGRKRFRESLRRKNHHLSEIPLHRLFK